MTGIGELNRRLVLEQPVESDDGEGGVARGYEAAATLWAAVTPAGGRADIAAGSLGAAVTHRIVIRAGRTLSTVHRFRDGARIFRIVAFRPSADRRFTEVSAEERED